MERDRKKRLLVIMAHPDDAELLCFGTIAKHLSHGGECKIVIATDGSKGGTDRLEESKEAFFELPVDMDCLHLDDGNVQFNIYTNTVVRSIIRMYNPDYVITHYPDSTGVEHQDHTAIAKAVINTVIKTKSNIKKVLLAEPLISTQTAFNPNCFVDITEWNHQKQVALKRHESQSAKYYINEDYLNWRTSIHSMSVPMKDMSKAYEAFELLIEVDID